ncbi:MAG: hypothetical protein RLZ10_3073 [Bacteroidota bacterium]|jgi:hypothetical protein
MKIVTILKSKFHLMFLSIILITNLNAQVSIINASINSFNITGTSICQVTLMNSSTEMSVILDAKLYNSAGEIILESKTMEFTVRPGLNAGNTLAFSLEHSNFGTSAQAQFIQTNHSLSSGIYKYCVNLTIVSSGEISDEYCEDLESQFSEYLYLVSPTDKDVIEEKNPLLIWTHSEPFNILAQGEYFRMIVVELSKEQDAEAGVTNSIPVFYKNYVSSHSVQYPIDATPLEEGKRYGWQVQKMSNGTVINKTESWEFTINKKIEPTENKYAVLKKKLDGGFYTAENNKVFFRFNESYISGDLTCRILDESRNPVKPLVKNETDKKEASERVNIKTNGVNLFEIDLTELDIKKGYYQLEVKNSKKEKYLLKIYVD